MNRALLPCLFLALAGCATAPLRPSLMSSGPEWVRSATPPSLAGRQVLFVAGFMHELIPGYFDDNAALARELGAETSVLFPPSGGGLDDDVALIEREVELRRGLRVVLVGHSKGGAAVLLATLRHPEWITSGRVEATIVVQGAIGGSPLADALSRPIHAPGLRDLTTAQAASIFGRALAALDERLAAAERARVFSRVFYVRSSRREGLVPLELSLTELALRAHGPNDGLLTQASMRLGFGVDLGVLDCDHASLTVSSFLSVSNAAERRAFTASLFGEVGRYVGWVPQAR